LKKKKIAIIGTRGIPAKYGGFETFAEELSVRLAELGINITVFCDKDSFNSSKYKNVNLVFVTYTKTQNPILYYLKSIVEALKHYDIIYVTGTGGSFFYFINLIYRKIIVTNNDGIEYNRAKWNSIKKAYIYLSEILAVKLSNYIIADSNGIYDYLTKKYSRAKNKIKVIEYGAYINEEECDINILSKYKLIYEGYYLVVARLEPENNIDIIIKGFLNSNSQHKLIVIGNILQNDYNKALLKTDNNRVVFLGGIYDKLELKNIRKGCLSYFHGHSAGGTNPSLLEAMANSNYIFAHDNVFNREVTDNHADYFINPEDVIAIVNSFEKKNDDEKNEIKKQMLNRIKNYYNWERIAYEYEKFFNEVNS
jgi:glycosyltransferase involved in cell wall biosynthesis